MAAASIRRRSTVGQRRLRTIVIMVVALLAMVVTAGPLVLMALAGVMTQAEVTSTPPTLIPAEPQWSNFGEVFERVPFARYLLNSLLVAGIAAPLSTVISSMAGYALARLRFPGRDLLFVGVLSTMMVPFAVTVIPLFLFIRNLGLLNSYIAISLPFLASGYGIFLFRQFFLSMPKELEEAATVDGATPVRVFRSVAVPLARPIYAALGALNFLFFWNMYFWPLIVTQSGDMLLVQNAMGQFVGQHSTDWQLIMAASTMAIIPGLFIFVFLQRYLVAGVKLSGLRG
jgi:multiple sugar transport system permease protein